MLSPLAWYLTLLGIGLLGGVFAFVARSASLRAEPSTEGVASVRRKVAWLLGVAAFPITLGSLAYAPFRTEAATDPAVEVVEVVGHQWYWELSRTEVPVGELVVFRVTSADVNHGFALYDQDLHVVAQTQAMPGYTNGLQVRFERPGRYRILCLEYCGLVHHGMSATLDVVAPATADASLEEGA